MTTQSLRGMANHGPMHWRGDRHGEGQGTSAQPDGGAFNEVAAFMSSTSAFDGLLGRAEPLTPQQMQAFADFMLQVMYPPNPIRALDNSSTPTRQAGREFFFNNDSFVFGGEIFKCVSCHVTRSERQRGVRRRLPGLLRHERAGVWRRVLADASRSRTCATCTPRSACSASPRIRCSIALSLPFFDPSPQGDQIRAFGYYTRRLEGLR